ncbi:MAG: hypothetical protein IPH12_14705 [Saprospirales bacterium]|nr:hypothetical protein [Saprospirales bacterium]
MKRTTMERPNHIDDLLRRRIRQMEVPPPDFVWTNVERTLRRRKRRFIVWLFAAGIAGAGIWSVWARPGISGQAENGRTPPAQQAPATAPRPAPSAGQTPPAIAVPSPTTRQDIQHPAPAPIGRKSTGEPVAVEYPGPYPNKLAAGEQGANPLVAQLVAAPGQVDYPADLLPGRLEELGLSSRLPALSPVALASGKKKNQKKCYDFHSNRQAWLFDVYAGPSAMHKRLDAPNPEFKDYAQERLNTEKRAGAFHAGIRVSYLFAENFILRTGLHYDRFVEQFEFIDPNYIKYTVIITQKLINGQWISVPDTVDIQYGSNYVKTYNRLALLDIPLQAALELRSGPTGVSLNLGGSVNVLFQKSGSLLALNGEPVTFTPGAQQQYDVFRPRVGLSLLGSIQWFYHISPRIRVFAEPYYRHILEPVTQPAYPLRQTHGIGGIRFGVTRIFD